MKRERGDLQRDDGLTLSFARSRMRVSEASMTRLWPRSTASADTFAALRRWMWWIHLVPAAAPPISSAASPLGLSLPPSRVSMDRSRTPRLPASRKRGDGGRKRQLEETCRGGVAGSSSLSRSNTHSRDSLTAFA